MRKLLPITILAMALFSCKTEKIDISKITVLDSNFKLICVIEETERLNNVCDHWKGLEPIDDISKIQWTHKIDIKSKNIGGRWLYSQEGYIAKLNKELNPRYKVSCKGVLNKLILGF